MSALSRGKCAVIKSLSTSLNRKKRKLSPDSEARYYCEAGLDPDGFERRFVSKFVGFGVFTTKKISKGEFLLEYAGERKTEAQICEEYKHNHFLFGFGFHGKSYWIDGSKTDRMCKMVNDAQSNTAECNCKMKRKIFNNYPRLCLYATRDIDLGEELRYDYGDNPERLFWRHQDRYTVTSTFLFGDINSQNFENFEYQIQGTRWQDISEAQVVKLLENMGGIRVLSANAEETVIVCADDCLHSSSRCVGKDWVFLSIVSGKILPTNYNNTSQQEILQESDNESDSARSTTLELPALNKIFIQTTGSKANGKRNLKRQCCIYCEELVFKIPRHMETNHSEEPEVAKILAMKKKSKERREAWSLIVSKGNNMHNSKVRERGYGTLIPKYRPSSDVSLPEKKYYPCEYCRTLIVSSDLWKHHRSCLAKPDGEKSTAPKKNACPISPISESTHKDFDKAILNNIRDDLIGQKAKSDPLIVEFGVRKFEKTGKYEHTHPHISCRMRELARLVIAVNKLVSSVTSLEQCIKPTMWNTLLTAIKDEAGFNNDDQTFSSASYCAKIGHNLNKCAKLMRSQAATAEDPDMNKIERVKLFMNLYEDEYDERIASLARDSLYTSRFNRVQLLPLVEDVQKLSKYLEAEIEKNLTNGNTSTVCKNLSKLILAQVILFNRKRSGEAERLKKEDFLKCSLQKSVDDEVSKSLTLFEQKLCESHFRVETRGKKGRRVSVLFTDKMKTNLEKLIKLQEELGINSSYLFVNPNGNKPFRGSGALKEVASAAGLKYHDRINSTSLRKQLATVCQVLNLTESSQDIIARFMGHDIRVHREYYRLPQSTLEVAKVSKLLHLMNSGHISKAAGTDLNTIDVSSAEVEMENPSDDEQELDIDDSSDDVPVKSKKKRPRKIEMENPSDDEQELDIDDSSDDVLVKSKKKRPRKIAMENPSDDGQELDIDDSSDDHDYVPVKSKKKRPRKIESSSEDTDTEAARKSFKKGPCRRKPWTKQEKDVVLKKFGKLVHLGKLPGKFDCQCLIQENSVLKNRSWNNIKDFVRNQTETLKRSLKRK